MDKLVRLSCMETSQAETSARESVLAALVWFDVFNYPLTAVEAAKYSRLFGAPATVGEANDVLSSTEFVNRVGGYYRLARGESHTALRQRRHRRAGDKIARAKKVAKVFGLWPSVRLIGLCNSLAIANAADNSDIDLFIVCRPGTLWLTRLVLAVPLILLGMRPTPSNQKDKICLSFFVSERALNMSRLRQGSDDPYLRFWTETVVPLYDAGGVYAEYRLSNSGQNSEDIHRWKQVRLGITERSAKWIQMRRFPSHIKNMANLDSRVIISDDILKFHVNDRRQKYREQFRRRLTAHNI